MSTAFYHPGFAVPIGEHVMPMRKFALVAEGIKTMRGVTLVALVLLVVLGAWNIVLQWRVNTLSTELADQEKVVELKPDPAKPFVGMAFKIVEDPFGQLTFLRIYQGKINKGDMYINQRTQKKDRFSRIVKMHADKREEIDAAEAGDIVAIMGIDCASGDTYSS